MGETMTTEQEDKPDTTPHEYHVMIDLETLGAGNSAAIISIGAVMFDVLNPELEFRKFYTRIPASSSQALGGVIDGDTVAWWMHPDRNDARTALLAEEPVDMVSALYGFAEWFGPDSKPVWGNGATFDNVILRSAFKNAGAHVPWGFWHDRCHRTIKSLAPDIKPDFTHCVQHHALGDAIAQTRQLLNIATKLNLKLS